jgi:hypothetical protein
MRLGERFDAPATFPRRRSDDTNVVDIRYLDTHQLTLTNQCSMMTEVMGVQCMCHHGIDSYRLLQRHAQDAPQGFGTDGLDDVVVHAGAACALSVRFLSPAC